MLVRHRLRQFETGMKGALLGSDPMGSCAMRSCRMQALRGACEAMPLWGCGYRASELGLRDLVSIAGLAKFIVSEIRVCKAELSGVAAYRCGLGPSLGQGWR